GDGGPRGDAADGGIDVAAQARSYIAFVAMFGDTAAPGADGPDGPNGSDGLNGANGFAVIGQGSGGLQHLRRSMRGAVPLGGTGLGPFLAHPPERRLTCPCAVGVCQVGNDKPHMV